MVAGGLNRYILTRRNGTLLSVAIIPLLMGPLELNFLEASNRYMVENTITIHASPEAVWQQIINVNTIEEGEIPDSLTSIIGVPKPIEANMNAQGVGAVRTSTWEKGVSFNEVITQWVPNERMTYTFDIDTTLIPDHAMDKHVKMGGEYFSPTSGGYFISQDALGNTVLRIETSLLDNTNFGVYSRVWGEIIFRDFHRSLLTLIKTRSERTVNP